MIRRNGKTECDFSLAKQQIVHLAFCHQFHLMEMKRTKFLRTMMKNLKNYFLDLHRNLLLMIAVMDVSAPFI